MTGDVVVEGRSLAGFPYYQQIIDRLKTEVPEIDAAVPIISTGGLININNIQQPVQVMGFTREIGRVIDWPTNLYAQYQALADKPSDPEPNFALLPDVNYKAAAGPRAKEPLNRPGMIVSDGLIGIRPGKDPKILEDNDETRGIMRTARVSLMVVPMKPRQSPQEITPVPDAFWIVDDSRPRLWQLDFNSVYIPFEVAQKDLHMNEFNGEPARASEIRIKAKPGTDLIKLRDTVRGVVDSVFAEHPDESFDYPVRAMTWEESQGKYIDAVEHEVVLTTALFGIISMVAVLLIFCIFYMIVVEKTKDIGIIKSVGATSAGIMQLFLGYGLAIGVVGAAMGFTLAFLIVRNINELHAWLGRRMGIVIWSPETYQFDTIPNHMNPQTVAWILAVAVLSALVGALVPAVRAARMEAVEALRYE
jgi:ABC-type lipoprotein release transport system permease subunit